MGVSKQPIKAPQRDIRQSPVARLIAAIVVSITLLVGFLRLGPHLDGPGINLLPGFKGNASSHPARPTATKTPGNGVITTSPLVGDGWHGPPMGWNHYNHFTNDVNEQLMRQVIDAMAANGMRDAGYRYINLDDSWQARDANGHLTTNGNFPSGLKALADYAHSKGFRFGVYAAVGDVSCNGNPGNYGHIQDDVNSFASWDVDFIKLDWCGNPRSYDTGWVRDQTRQWEKAIQASGRSMILSISTAGAGQPWTWACQDGTANLWRVSHDIHDGWNDGAGSIMDIINGSYLQQSSACAGHVSDPDMLEVGNGGLTADEQRSQFALWAMLSAPLIAGNDPRSLDQTTRSILLNQEIIAVDQDALFRQATKVRDQNGVQYWVKPLSDGGHAVVIFNTNGNPTSASVQWKDLGFGGTFRARDLWAHSDLGSLTGWSGQVASHGVVMLRMASYP